jgi:hypothetical protein
VPHYETLESIPLSRDLVVLVKVMSVSTQLEESTEMLITVDVEEWVSFGSTARVGTVTVPYSEWPKLNTSQPVLVREVDVLWTGVSEYGGQAWMGPRAKRYLDKYNKL